MAFAQNGDLQIHYEVEGSGPPVVLQHGFSDSLESWREYGYVDGVDFLENGPQAFSRSLRGMPVAGVGVESTADGL